MKIGVEGYDLPGPSCGPSPDSPGGYHSIHVGIQRRGKPDELLGLTAASEPAAGWTIDCEIDPVLEGADDGPPDVPDLKGRYIQGPPGARFIYLSWVTVDQAGAVRLFRRAKLRLDAVPPEVVAEASRLGLLVGRLGLTDGNGSPTCAAVRPPVIDWSAPARLAL
jgi:hypothetical protein